MNDNKDTAAQPLDLDKLEALARKAYLANEVVAMIPPAKILDLIAQSRASQPEGATLASQEGITGTSQEETTGASESSQKLRGWLKGTVVTLPADFLHSVADELDDLRAQLAATTENLQTAVRQAWEANAELSKLRAAPASAQPDRGAAAPVYALGASTSIEGIADELEAEALNYEGDFADTVKGCVEALREIAASPASQPVAPEAAQADDMNELMADRDEFVASAHAYQEAAPIHQWRQKTVGSYQPAWYDATKEEAYARVDGHYEARTVYLAAPKAAPDHSEREAANAGGLRHAVEDALREESRGTSGRLILDFHAEKALRDALSQSHAIAAGQEAANAKDAAHVTYTCKGKGGAYSLIGVAYGAGTSRDTTVNLYREVGTGVMYFRTPADFHDRMERINAAMAAVGAAGQEGGDK